MRARVHVTLKNGVLDPEGEAVRHALATLGFAGIGEVRVGKVIDIDLEGVSPQEAEAQVRTMCEQLLANTVIENYVVDLA